MALGGKIEKEEGPAKHQPDFGIVWLAEPRGLDCQYQPKHAEIELFVQFGPESDQKLDRRTADLKGKVIRRDNSKFELSDAQIDQQA